MKPTIKYVTDIFERLKQKNPNPKCDLDYTNNYTLLVAIVLSAQSTDKGVNKAMAPLFKIIKTPQDMLDFGIDNLKKAVQSIGLYNTKSTNIMKFSKILVDEYDGIVPNSSKTLESFPGVGRKSANVLLNVSFGHPTMAVDTHVFRVSHRLNLSNGKTPLHVEKDLLDVVPKEYLTYGQHWLVLHGRYICKAKKPDCILCCLKDICPSSML